MKTINFNGTRSRTINIIKMAADDIAAQNPGITKSEVKRMLLNYRMLPTDITPYEWAEILSGVGTNLHPILDHICKVFQFGDRDDLR